MTTAVSCGPLKRSIRVQWPDGMVNSVKLPCAARVKLGGLASIAVVWPRSAPPDRQHLIVLWFRRIKGGWELKQPAGGSR
jgi:hypothetical protein